MGIFDIFKKKKPEPLQPDPIVFEGATAYEKLQNLVIQDPNINLQKDEVCFYSGTAQAYHKKNVVTGYSGRSAGVSVRVAKGLSVHTGGSGGKSIRGDVVEKYPGRFYLTNKRLILLAEKYGFAVSIPKILQIQFRSDGIIIHLESKQHTFLTQDVERIKAIIGLMNEVQSEQ